MPDETPQRHWVFREKPGDRWADTWSQATANGAQKAGWQVVDVDELAAAAQALFELVEMDESVGRCLSSRQESITLGTVLFDSKLYDPERAR